MIAEGGPCDLKADHIVQLVLVPGIPLRFGEIPSLPFADGRLGRVHVIGAGRGNRRRERPVGRRHLLQFPRRGSVAVVRDDDGSQAFRVLVRIVRGIGVHKGTLDHGDSDVPSFRAAGRGVPADHPGVDGKLGPVGIGLYVPAGDRDAFRHFIVRAGADAGRAPSADCRDRTAGDAYMNIRILFIGRLVAAVIGAGADTGRALFHVRAGFSSHRQHRAAGDLHVALIAGVPAADARAVGPAVCPHNSAAGNGYAGISRRNRRSPRADVSFSLRPERAEGAVSDPGSRGSAGRRDIAARDHHDRFTLVSAADPRAALVRVSPGIDGRVDRTAGDRHICVAVHTAADARAHVVGRVRGDVSAVDRHIRAVVSGPLGEPVVVRFAGAEARTDAGVAPGIDRTVVNDNFAAVHMVAAADPGAVPGAGRGDIAAVDGDRSPRLVCMLVGSVG